jgi:hypothetical protein
MVRKFCEVGSFSPIGIQIAVRHLGCSHSHLPRSNELSVTSLHGTLICLSKSGFATLQCGLPNWLVFLSQIVEPNWVLPNAGKRAVGVTRFVVASIESAGLPIMQCNYYLTTAFNSLAHECLSMLPG